MLTIEDENMLWLKTATHPHLILFNKRTMSLLESKDLNLLLFQELKMFCSCHFFPLNVSADCITCRNSHQASHNFSYLPVISVDGSALGILNSQTC